MNAFLSVTCPFCGAKVGYHCMTLSNNVARTLHTGRIDKYHSEQNKIYAKNRANQKESSEESKKQISKSKFNWRISDLSGVKTNDWIFLSTNGWTEVDQVTQGVINVKFDDKSNNNKFYSFYFNGKFREGDKYPSAWTECPFPDGPAKPIIRPDFKVDHPVIVGVDSNRHFCRWPKKSERYYPYGIVCWKDGLTGWSLEETPGQSSNVVYWRDWQDGKIK